MFSPTWASYVGQMTMPNSTAFVKESNKEDLSPFHPILQFLSCVVDLTCQLDSDQEISQQQCRCQLTLLCCAARLGIVLRSLVQSGFSSKFGKNETETSPPSLEMLKKLDWTFRDQFTAVFCGFLQLKDRSEWVMV